jgi:hypothetical protein
VAAMSGAAMYISYRSELGPNAPTKCIKLAKRSLALGTILIAAYITLLGATTVTDPATGKTRYQIGFRKAAISLTPAGENLKKNFPSATLQQWMDKAAAFREGGPEIIWQSWSVRFLGFFLICLYVACFFCFSGGFALLARHHVLTRAGQPA